MSDLNAPQAKALDLARAYAGRYLDDLQERSVGATATIDELRAKLDVALPDDGLPAHEAVEHVIGTAEAGLLGSSGPRFFAWVIGGALDSALAADWITSTWDQNAAMAACSPAAAVVEEVVGKWLKEVLLLPSEASFAITSGCQMAHVTCLAAARSHVFQRHGVDVQRQGLCGSPQIKVIANAQRHGSIDCAVRLLGLGSDSVRAVDADAGGRMNIADLQQALAECDGPVIVVLSAGDINTGCFDDFTEIIPRAKRHGAWVHIDGAFGLVAQASKDKRALLRGVEAADSWATDGHKWLNVPFDCGFAFVRDSESHRRAMTGGGNYVKPSGECRDQIDWNPEWSRRARGFPIYAAMLELGRSGLSELVDRCCRLARRLVEEIGAVPGAEMLWRPELNQGLVRFLHPTTQATEAEHDQWTDRMIEAINASGKAFFSGTTWCGKRAMRISVVNWRTTDDDVDRTVQAVADVVRHARQAYSVSG